MQRRYRTREHGRLVTLRVNFDVADSCDAESVQSRFRQLQVQRADVDRLGAHRLAPRLFRFEAMRDHLNMQARRVLGAMQHRLGRLLAEAHGPQRDVAVARKRSLQARDLVRAALERKDRMAVRATDLCLVGGSTSTKRASRCSSPWV